MSSTIFSFLGLFMIATIVNSRKIGVELPRQVNYLQMQCAAKGFPGACVNYMMYQNELECSELPCARPVANNRHKVVYSGPIADGTQCGFSKICIHGICERVEPRFIPRQVNSGAYFSCDANTAYQRRK